MTIRLTIGTSVPEPVVNLNSFTFNGGEESVRLGFPYRRGEEHFTITAALTTSAEIMQLALITDAIRRKCDKPNITLNMPYIPYARQDRVCNPGEALGIRVFCDMINAMQFDTVRVLMPHSDVASALLNNCDELRYEVNWEAFVESKISNTDRRSLTIVSPDAGAMKRTLKFAQNYNNKVTPFEPAHVIMADKVRDVMTGQITSTVVHATREQVEGETCLIYDDICDGGMTFIKLAEALRNLGAKKIILAVPHGIFSKGLIEIAKVIDQIITTNVFEDNMPEYRSIDVNIMNIGNI